MAELVASAVSDGVDIGVDDAEAPELIEEVTVGVQDEDREEEAVGDWLDDTLAGVRVVVSEGDCEGVSAAVAVLVADSDASADDDMELVRDIVEVGVSVDECVSEPVADVLVETVAESVGVLVPCCEREPEVVDVRVDVDDVLRLSLIVADGETGALFEADHDRDDVSVAVTDADTPRLGDAVMAAVIDAVKEIETVLLAVAVEVDVMDAAADMLTVAAALRDTEAVADVDAVAVELALAVPVPVSV